MVRRGGSGHGAAVGVVLAAGYCLTLGWLRPRHTHTLEEGWTPLYLCF